jgi:pyruvate/2-oxoglutarate dehydrogenase complex dihydrolipoamide acyltransferase (E2) component
MESPTYTESPFSLERKQIVDFLSIGKSKHHAYALIELDITGIRDQLRRLGRAHKSPLSLTGFLLNSFVQAIAVDKSMQGYRKGSKLIVFDEIDVSTMVERKIDGVPRPVGYVLRNASEKSLLRICQEIREAKNHTQDDLIDSEEMTRKKKFYSFVKRTGFLRRWFLHRMARDPFMKKKLTGTVGFSSMGMFSSNIAGWIVPITPHTLTAMVGGIRKQMEMRDAQLSEREIVCMTIAMDHDILDGAPTARFIDRLKRIVEKGLEPEVQPVADLPVMA